MEKESPCIPPSNIFENSTSILYFIYCSNLKTNIYLCEFKWILHFFFLIIK